MYEGSGLDYGDAYEYGDMDLDESMYLDGHYTHELDEEYARDSYDLDALAYRHYAWYNTTITFTRKAMLAQKRRVQVVLDLEVYDDLDLKTLEWEDILALEGGESVSVKIKEFDDIYWELKNNLWVRFSDL